MNITYEDIRNEIEIIFNRNNLILDRVEKIYLPSEYFSIFKDATVGEGYNLTWWKIPVEETKGSSIYFITKNKGE